MQLLIRDCTLLQVKDYPTHEHEYALKAIFNNEASLQTADIYKPYHPHQINQRWQVSFDSNSHKCELKLLLLKKMHDDPQEQAHPFYVVQATQVILRDVGAAASKATSQKSMQKTYVLSTGTESVQVSLALKVVRTVSLAQINPHLTSHSCSAPQGWSQKHRQPCCECATRLREQLRAADS